MKICNKHGNGVCINCNQMPFKAICRYKAEEALDLLNALTKTKLTEEQLDVLEDFKELTMQNDWE